LPLHCDCYGGCWADHSVDWVKVGTEANASQLHELAHTTLPYGTYVYIGKGYDGPMQRAKGVFAEHSHVRVETQELADKLIAKFNLLAGSERAKL
jgi:hypothetical protein